MPLIFVHGVSNRDNDPAYQQGVKIRQKMVSEIIGPQFPDHPSMSTLQHVYWGDIGVKFRWNMASLPTESTVKAEKIDVDKLGEAVELVEFLSVHVGDEGTSPILNSAKADPAGLIDAIANVLAQGGLIEDSEQRDSRVNPRYSKFATFDGEKIADLLLRCADAKNDEAFLSQLKESNSDVEVVDLLNNLFSPESKDGELKQELLSDTASDAWAWMNKKFYDANEWVKTKWTETKDAGKRAASVAVLRRVREDFSKASFLFFGDIFEYIKRGQGENGTIKHRVRDEIRQFAKVDSSDEPLVVITHSFGGEVVYDLLSSGELTETPIDLWVTVGSQVGLFAEMSIYDQSPLGVPDSGVLGKPAGVENWVNIYDTVDVFSFLCEPVFGKDAVTDVKIGTGNALSAHGAYFSNPKFYEEVLSRIPKNSETAI